jgi:hypothetical protein
MSAPNVGDVNNDGIADVVTSAFGVVDVFYGPRSGILAAPVTVLGGMNPAGVGIGDISGDGRADIIVATAGSAP